MTPRRKPAGQPSGASVIAKRAADRWFCCRMRPICRFTTAGSTRFFARAKRAAMALERFFDPLAELVVHGLLFTAPIGGAAQDHGLLVSGWRASLTSTPSWTVRHPSAAASAELNFFSSDFGAPMM